MNKPRETKSLLVALDIGTSKIVAIVAELQADGNLKVVGLGQHPSRGLKKGVVVNIDSTVQAIQRLAGIDDQHDVAHGEAMVVKVW